MSTSTTARAPSEAASNSKRTKALPYSMIAADLNGDHRPEILVGYVKAPGVVYFNEGTGKKFSRFRSATDRARSTAWRPAI